MRKRKRIGRILPITLLLFCIVIFIGQFNQIDSYEYPHDKKIILQNDAQKIVIREMKSGKTNEIKIDTVQVRDRFIFRKIIKS